MSIPSIGPIETQALKALWDHHSSEGRFLSFKAIAANGGPPLFQVRRAVRSLARKGLAVFAKGLWTDEGEMYGSGYGLTELGAEVASAKFAPVSQPLDYAA